MDTFEAIATRRSIKQFDPQHRFTEDEFRTLLDAALLAPTSFNIQHWRLIHVSDTELRRQLRVAAWDQAQVTDASALLVIAGDVAAWNRQPERYWRNAPPERQQMIVNMLSAFYQDKAALQRDEAIRSGAMAAQNLMLAARAMGYDSNAMIGFDSEQVAELVRLPADHVIVMMLAIGKRLAPAWPRGGQLRLEEVLIRNRFDS